MKVGRILVDGDPAVYRAGFAAQTTHYVIVYEKDGVLGEHVQEGDSRPWQRQLIKDGGTVLHVETRIVPQDVSIAYMALDAQFKAIYRKCSDHFGGTHKHGMEIIMSGTGNYRDKIATVLGYKANRKDMVKPVHFKAIREYLKQSWSATFVDGREADDEVATRMVHATQDGTPCVLVTIDKDLDQIPGLHYNYKNHVFYYVTQEEGVLLFYAQALSGDQTDNIPGLRGIGPSKAMDAVLGWHKDWLEFTSVNKQERTQLGLEKFLWMNVVSCYEKIPLGLAGEAKYEGTKTAEELALEMARLVFLQRYRNQLWTPPGALAEEIG